MAKEYGNSRTVRRNGSKRRTCPMCHQPVNHWRWIKHQERHKENQK